MNRRGFAVGIGTALTVFATGDADATANDAAMSIGRADAPLQLEEYASASCSHCAHFHAVNWAQLKSNYIDTGRLRLTLREMLTPPQAVALAMFQLARGGDASGEEYFGRLGLLFERQAAIFAAGTMAGVRDSLLAAAAEFGMTPDQAMACMNDPARIDRIQASIAEADQRGVTSTPSFFLNGQRLDNDFQTAEGMVRSLDAALARR